MHVIHPLTPISTVARAPPKTLSAAHAHPSHAHASLHRDPPLNSHPIRGSPTGGKAHARPKPAPLPLLSETFALALARVPSSGGIAARTFTCTLGHQDWWGGSRLRCRRGVWGKRLERGRAGRAEHGGCQVSRRNVQRPRGVSVVNCTPMHVVASEAERDLICRRTMKSRGK
jgi:hypothetical protein